MLFHLLLEILIQGVLLGGTGASQLQVVAIAVGPHEDSTMLMQIHHSVLKKLGVLVPNVVLLLEAPTFFRALCPLLDCNSHGGAMGIEAVKIEHVLIKLRLDRISLQIVLFGTTGIILIAGIVAPSGRAMLFPRATAKPTKLVTATLHFLSTRHVHATTILFNVLLALGTALGVGHEPLDILRLVAVLVVPGFDGLARGGQMVANIGIRTLETKHKTASTRHRLPSTTSITLDRVFAPWVGAPLHVGVLIDKGAMQKLFVALKSGRLHDARKTLLVAQFVALGIHTVGEHTIWTPRHLNLQVVSPARLAITVTTTESKSIAHGHLIQTNVALKHIWTSRGRNL